MGLFHNNYGRSCNDNRNSKKRNGGGVAVFGSGRFFKGSQQRHGGDNGSNLSSGSSTSSPEPIDFSVNDIVFDRRTLPPSDGPTSPVPAVSAHRSGESINWSRNDIDFGRQQPAPKVQLLRRQHNSSSDDDTRSVNSVKFNSRRSPNSFDLSAIPPPVVSKNYTVPPPPLVISNIPAVGYTSYVDRSGYSSPIGYNENYSQVYGYNSSSISPVYQLSPPASCYSSVVQLNSPYNNSYIYGAQADSCYSGTSSYINSNNVGFQSGGSYISNSNNCGIQEPNIYGLSVTVNSCPIDYSYSVPANSDNVYSLQAANSDNGYSLQAANSDNGYSLKTANSDNGYSLQATNSYSSDSYNGGLLAVSSHVNSCDGSYGSSFDSSYGSSFDSSYADLFAGYSISQLEKVRHAFSYCFFF